MTIRGDAGFKYTDPSTATETTVALESPLRELLPSEYRARFERWSLDGTARDVVTVSSRVRQVTARLRYEDDYTALALMLVHGLDDVTLNYYPSLADTLISYPCKLVAVNGSTDLSLSPDADLWFRYRYEVTVTLRRVDGGTFDALLTGA